MQWQLIWKQESQKSSVEDNIQMVEVRQSFRHGSHFYVRCFTILPLLTINITNRAELFFIITRISLCWWTYPLPVKFVSNSNLLTVEDCPDKTILICWAICVPIMTPIIVFRSLQLFAWQWSMTWKNYLNDHLVIASVISFAPSWSFLSPSSSLPGLLFMDL